MSLCTLLLSMLILFRQSWGNDTGTTITVTPNPICEEQARLLNIQKNRYDEFRDLQDALLSLLTAIETKMELSISISGYDNFNCSSMRDTAQGISTQLGELKGLVQSMGGNAQSILTTPKSCAQVQLVRKVFGVKPLSGVYALNVNGRTVRAYCDMDTQGGGWTIFQRRLDMDTDFNRKWDEYKNGFGHPEINYWLGNDVINVLTSTDGFQELRIEITDWNDTEHHITYEQFAISNEQSDYTLRLGNGKVIDGDLPDALYGMHNGKEFGTHDKHFNHFPCINCPKYCGGAWWYGCCYMANLNAKLMKEGSGGDNEVQAARWHNKDTKSYMYAKSTQMKFRPPGFGKH